MQRRTFLAGAATLAAPAAHAHHGWGWAEGEQTTLTGTIRQVTIAPPHPTLQVQGSDGAMWTVELGNPTQTSRAGFVDGVARPGDQITALGNRSLNQGERRLKAVRVTVNDRRFDIYPERITSR